jgi:hypothetical protein
MKEGAERLSAKTTSDPSEKANHLQRAESAKVNQEAAVNARDQQMANISTHYTSIVHLSTKLQATRASFYCVPYLDSQNLLSNNALQNNNSNQCSDG